MLRLNHKNLTVYKNAISLVKEVYILTTSFPLSEKFALAAQLRRAAISVCSNIAEGSARPTDKERKRFYEIARSSIVELDCEFEIVIEIGYTNSEKIKNIMVYLNPNFSYAKQNDQPIKIISPIHYSPFTIHYSLFTIDYSLKPSFAQPSET